MLAALFLAGPDAVAETSSPLLTGGIAVRERLASYWQSLDLTAQTLSAGSVPDAWDAGFFLDMASLNALLSQAAGLTIRHNDTGVLAGATVQVTAVRLIPKAGALDAELELVAAKSGLSIPLKAAASITFQGIAKPAPDRDPVLTLRIEPTEFFPNVGHGVFGAVERSFFTTLIPDLAVALANPHTLELHLQLPDRVDIPLGLQKQQTVSVNGGSGSVSFKATMMEGSIVQRIAYEGPIFSEKGIWLLGRLSDRGTRPVTPRKPPTDRAELQRKVAALEAAVSTQLASSLSTASELYIGKSLLLSLAEKLRTLDASKRRVSFVTTGQSGYLAGHRQSMGVLGNVGVQAVLLDNDSGTGQVDFDFGQASWSNGTFKLPIAAAMKAAVKVQLNIDVIASGVVRTSVGMVGAGNASMTATAKPLVVTSGPQRIAALGFPGTCSLVRADIKTDGVLKTDFGWTKVPSVGGRISSPIGPLPTVLVLDPRPHFTKLPTQTVGAWSVVPKYPAVITMLTPKEFSATSEGFNLQVELAAAPVEVRQGAANQEEELKAAEARTKAQADAVVAASTEALKKAPEAGACPGNSEFALLLGDLEFGPNNELVRVLVLLGKLPKEALETVKRLPGEVAPEKIKGWIENPADSVRRGEVGRQVDRLQKETSPEKVKEWTEKPVDSFKRSTPGQIITDPIGAAGRLFH